MFQPDPLVFWIIAGIVGILAFVFLVTAFAAAVMIFMGPPDTFDVEIKETPDANTKR